jgi:hypothetical protein
MTRECLSILYVSPVPTSPPCFGAQARMHGLLSELARRHDVTAVALIDDAVFDADECRRAMKAYCREVVLVPVPKLQELNRRLLQFGSLASTRSFERLLFTVPALQPALDQLLRAQQFHIVNLEFSSLRTASSAKLHQARSSRPSSWTRITSTTTWLDSTPASATAWPVASTPG